MKNEEKTLLAKYYFTPDPNRPKYNLAFEHVGMSTNVVYDISIPFHHHTHYELLCVLDGEITHKTEWDNNEEVLSIGDIRFIPPNHKHSLVCNGHSIHRDIIIDCNYFNNLINFIGIPEPIDFSNVRLKFDEVINLDDDFQQFTTENNSTIKSIQSINLLTGLLLKSAQSSNDKNLASKSYPDIINKLLNYFDRPFYLQLSLNDIISHEG